MKESFYIGNELIIKNDGIRIRKRKIFLPYSEIGSIKIKKAHITRGWLGLILLGVILNIGLLYLLYYFLVNFYDLSGSNTNHVHYSRRSPGMVIGVLLILPVVISIRIKRYFGRPLMLIIKWDRFEFRMKFSELNLSVEEMRRFLEGRGLRMED